MSTKRYAYRAYPTKGQARALARVFGSCRVVYNDYIAERERLYRLGISGQVPSGDTATLVTTAAKATPERAWLGEVSSVALQQSVSDARRAYTNYFDSRAGRRKGRGVGRPRFKSRRSRQSVRFTRNARFKVEERPHSRFSRVRIPGVGWVAYRSSRPLPSTPSSVTIIREADGTYHLSFVVQVPAAPLPTQLHPRTVGVDLGLTDFAAITRSDGTREKITNPRHLKTQQRKLARAQRELARRQKGSANRAKARAKVARVHRKVRETRLNFHHQLAARLIDENQVIAVEKLNVVGLARSGAKGKKGAALRRSIHDAGWATFLRIIDDKAAEKGRTAIAVNPSHTSQTCSVCGVLDGPKALKVRTWTCQGCGTVLDRDYNAAVNVMVAAGQAETLNARGGSVRPRLAEAAPYEAGTHRTALATTA